MDVKKGIRVGIMSANLPVPAQYDNEDRWVWLMKESAKWGCNVIHLSLVIEDENPAFVSKMRDLSQSLDMALEVRSIQELFSMTDATASDIRKAFETRIKTMKTLGTNVMRMGYGRLKIDSSRFNKNFPLKEHLDFMKKVLKFAAKIVEDNGVYLAIENHCDFKGEELAEVLADVNSYNVGCALDTANGYTVYNDPDAEVQALAPFAITSHIKDMAIVQETVPGRIPFRAVGSALGEGNVNIPKAIETIMTKGRNPDGIRLIVERGWMATENMTKEEADAYNTDVMKRSVDYLLKYAK